MKRKRKPKRPKSLIPAAYEGQLYTVVRNLHQAVWRSIKPFYVQRFQNEFKPVLKLAPSGVQATFTANKDQSEVAKFIATITAQMDQSAHRAQVDYGLQDAGEWSVVDTNVYDQIIQHQIELCQSTIDDMVAATNMAYEQIAGQLKKELLESQKTGETLLSLTDRLSQFFDEDSRWKARRIAHTESARAHNYGFMLGTQDWDEVLGYEWVLSSDACDLCKRVGLDANGEPAQVKKGTTFATFATGNPAYANVFAPPLHPSCRCSTVLVMDYEETRFGQSVTIANGKTDDYGEAPKVSPSLLNIL